MNETPTHLRCQVCGEQIAPERAKKRSNTCANKECINALRRFRLNILQMGKCPHCYHPSTPEEWAEFRAWRQWKANQSDTTLQAFMKAASGPTLRSLARGLVKALADAAGIVAARRTQILDESTLRRNGEPDLDTLQAEARAAIDGLDKDLAGWRELLEQANAVLPVKAAQATQEVANG